MKPRANRVRTLKPGDPIPDFEPRRYGTTDGYIRLRWKVGTMEYVEALEHRVVMGNPEGHVHHRNGVKTDNRPENLEVLTLEEHMAHHGAERAVDIARVVALYQEGFSTTQVAIEMGCNHGTVSRALAKAGVPARTLMDYANVGLDRALIFKLHEAGLGSVRIARRLSISRNVVTRVLKESDHQRRPGRTSITDKQADEIFDRILAS